MSNYYRIKKWKSSFKILISRREKKVAVGRSQRKQNWDGCPLLCTLLDTLEMLIVLGFPFPLKSSTMARLGARIEYEDLRRARILENKVTLPLTSLARKCTRSRWSRRLCLTIVYVLDYRLGWPHWDCKRPFPTFDRQLLRKNQEGAMSGNSPRRCALLHHCVAPIDWRVNPSKVGTFYQFWSCIASIQKPHFLICRYFRSFGMFWCSLLSVNQGKQMWLALFVVQIDLNAWETVQKILRQHQHIKVSNFVLPLFFGHYSLEEDLV